jgi:type I restriction enzyme S subunit
MRNLPPSWQGDRLKDIAQINSQTLSASTDPGYEFDYIEISNVDYFGVIDPSAIERLRFEDAPSRARRIIARHSTIISSVRSNLQAVAFFPDDKANLVCSTGFNVVQPIMHKLIPRFAYYVLISDYARQCFEAVATGVGYPAVADKDFGAFVVPMPPLSEQILIARFLDWICSQVDAVASSHKNNDKTPRATGILNQQMETLITYRKAVIHECVTGQRRVTDEDVKRAEAHGQT